MKVSNKDWTQLSAYLDGELNPREMSRLKTRLEHRPGLRAALNEIKRTKQILSLTPRVGIPRNFTLTPAMVGKPHRRSPERGYRLAAAALSFLFVAVAVVDLGSGMLKGGMLAASAPKSEEIALEALPEAAADAAVAEEVSEEPAVREAEEALPNEETADQAVGIAAEEESGAPEAAGQPSEESVATAETFAEQEEVKTAPEGTEQVAEEQVSEEPQNRGDSASVPAYTAVPEPEQISNTPAGETGQLPPRRGVPWIRILEISLGLGAAGFASAAWSKRRKVS